MGEIRLDKMSGAGPGFYPALFLESGMKKQQNDFLNGSILPSLLRFAGPVLLALFLQAMYGAVDLIVVGKFAGTADISAVSTGSQAMQLVTSLLVGLTTGVTVLLGQKIGEGKPDEAGSVIGSAICLFVCVALGLTVLLVTLAAPFCRLLQAPEEAFVPTTQYVRICSAGTLFIVAFNVIGSVFRGLGDSKMPLITVAIACVVLIGLFIYNTRWGYTIRMIGINQAFAKYSGMKVATVIVLSQVLGGFLAGIGGGIEMLGRYPTFSWSSLPGYGWTGITIAILAGNNPWFVPFASFFMAYLTKGCELMATYANVPSQLIDIIQGVIFLFFAAEQFLSGYRQKLVVKTAQEELAAKAALEAQKGGAEHA